MVKEFQKLEYLFCAIIVCSKIIQKEFKSVTTDGKRICRRVCRQRPDQMLVMLVLLENEEFCESSVIFLTIYAVVCSNVVVHL